MTRRAPSGTSTPSGGAFGVVYPISLCMIVRNEERFLAGALASVQGVVDEICIVDTGSTDGTVAIAESYGAKIATIVWRDDFAWARNQALALATGAWNFVLDADERLAEDSRPLLAQLRGVRPDGMGRWLRCRNFSDVERRIVASTNAIIRIFPNDPAIHYRGAIHEYVAREGEAMSINGVMTPIEIQHHGYAPAIMAERAKGQRNLRVSRVAFESAPDDAANVYNYAMSALLAGERDLAREQLERVIVLTANTPRGFRPMALATLGGLYLEAGQPAETLKLADECIAIVPTLPDGHFNRGRALAALGRPHDARTSLGKAIEVGQNRSFEHFVVDDEIATWKAHNEIGGTLVNEGRYPEALQWLDLGLQARPAERTLLLNRAKCLEAMGDLNAALAGFRTAFADASDENAAIEYVNFMFRHGSPDVARGAVEAALPRVSEDYQRAFLASAAAALLRAGRRDEAAAAVRRVLEVGDPSIARSTGKAIVTALAQQFELPELNALVADEARTITVRGGWQ